MQKIPKKSLIQCVPDAHGRIASGLSMPTLSNYLLVVVKFVHHQDSKAWHLSTMDLSIFILV